MDLMQHAQGWHHVMHANDKYAALTSAAPALPHLHGATAAMIQSQEEMGASGCELSPSRKPAGARCASTTHASQTMSHSGDTKHCMRPISSFLYGTQEQCQDCRLLPNNVSSTLSMPTDHGQSKQDSSPHAIPVQPLVEKTCKVNETARPGHQRKRAHRPAGRRAHPYSPLARYLACWPRPALP